MIKFEAVFQHPIFIMDEMCSLSMLHNKVFISEVRALKTIYLKV